MRHGPKRNRHDTKNKNDVLYSLGNESKTVYTMLCSSIACVTNVIKPRPASSRVSFRLWRWLLFSKIGIKR